MDKATLNDLRFNQRDYLKYGVVYFQIVVLLQKLVGLSLWPYFANQVVKIDSWLSHHHSQSDGLIALIDNDYLPSELTLPIDTTFVDLNLVDAVKDKLSFC